MLKGHEKATKRAKRKDKNKTMTYKNKKGEEKPYIPSASTIDSYDDVADDLCNIRGLLLMIASARDATNRGGDSVLDNHVGLVRERDSNSCPSALIRPYHEGSS